MNHAFTVDVEDWYHGVADVRERTNGERRLHIGLERLLGILERHQVKGTFFWLGLAAQTHPDLVRRVAEAGHELGCHGWDHELVCHMSPQVFREHTRRVRDVIADISGRGVYAYRAPYFSITRDSLWALDILADLGFRYDSSVLPLRHWRVGIEGFNPRPHRIDTASGPIVEMPVSVRRWGRVAMPASGGAYFRLYPYVVTRANFRALAREGQPGCFYVHPWEFDAERPIGTVPWKERISNNINRASIQPKLERLLRDFKFVPLSEALAQVQH